MADDDLVVLRAWSDEAAAACIQRHRRRTHPPPSDTHSHPTADADADVNAPAAADAAAAGAGVGAEGAKPSGGLPRVVVLVGLLALLVLNHLMTNVMDESGLPVLINSVAADPTANQTEYARWKAAAAAAAASAVDRSKGGVLRVELLETKDTADRRIVVVQVNARGRDDAGMADELVSALRLDEPPMRLRTVFPERPQWRLASTALAKDELPALGQVSMLSHEHVMQVRGASADAFALLWREFGYNSLGEAGVVRCDLLRQTDDSTMFLSRKVFRSAGAKATHEATPHYRRWAEAAMPLVEWSRTRAGLDTFFPPASFVPFRTAWAA